MKKLLLVLCLLAYELPSFAQKDVTKFLGIPVDGYKPEMIQKLREKGYTPTLFSDEILEGEFNGREVYLFFGTNNNKIYRIMVVDKEGTDERNIQIRFNNLCEQFKNSSKYIYHDYELIPEEEDISYEMIVKKKRYEASFAQTPEIDSAAISTHIISRLVSKYSEEELSSGSDKLQEEAYNMTLEYILETAKYKSVWFMISKDGGEYKINIYYDNKYNEASGEDL